MIYRYQILPNPFLKVFELKSIHSFSHAHKINVIERNPTIEHRMEHHSSVELDNKEEQKPIELEHAKMFAVAQVLELAAEQCERISGTAVTEGRIKTPGAAQKIKCEAATIIWPMPKVVNIFADSQQVLRSLNSCYLSGDMPIRQTPTRYANTTIKALSDLGVRVHLQWIPGVISDLRYRWAHEGARNALKPQYHGRKVYMTKVHRVHWRG